MSDYGFTDWYVDGRQNRRIRELQEGVAATQARAASESRALRSQLSQVRGNLEERLNRLAKSFDAFVELSDLRMELALYQDAGLVRLRVRRLLDGDPDLSTPLDDVPGYWLAPAADALAAWAAGRDAERSLAEAARRDAVRTAVFVVLARPSAAEPYLETAFPALGETATVAQRAVWTACASGAYGDPGRRLAARRVADLFTALPAERRSAEVRRWTADLDGKPPKLPPALRSETALTDGILAGDKLGKLRELIAPEPAADPVDTDPAVDTPPLGVPKEHRDLLDRLVDEGSAAEMPLLQRAAELRAVIENGAAAAPPKGWYEATGDTLDLICADSTGTDPERRLPALRVAAGELNGLAGELAKRAGARPPASITVRLRDQTMRIQRDGTVPLDDAYAEINRKFSRGPGRELAAIGVAVVGLLATAGFAIGPAVGVAASCCSSAASSAFSRRATPARGSPRWRSTSGAGSPRSPAPWRRRSRIWPPHSRAGKPAPRPTAPRSPMPWPRTAEGSVRAPRHPR